MASTHQVSFKLNGKPVGVTVEPRELLIHTLREKLAHTGPHIGCETSHCGACTVDVDGMSLKSCTVLAVQCEGADMLTVEGFEQAGVLHALQQAFHEEHGLQCGYCTPGMITRARRLLRGARCRSTFATLNEQTMKAKVLKMLSGVALLSTSAKVLAAGACCAAGAACCIGLPCCL